MFHSPKYIASYTKDARFIFLEACPWRGRHYDPAKCQ